MALQPGAGVPAGDVASGSSYMLPVNAGIGPPQGMMPMQQQPQGYPMISVMHPNMQNMMGMCYRSQMPQAAITIQGGMPMGPMQPTAMPFMGQSTFMTMRPPTPRYTPDMQKQFSEEQQKRFGHQQKFLEEQRKRRQFEEQKQKLRMLSSVKPKSGEKSRDDALEAIKGNMDGFSRDAKMHPAPLLHTKKTDFPILSHSALSVSQHFVLGADEEFSGFLQGPVISPSSGAVSPSKPFQPFSSSVLIGKLVSEQAVTVAQSPPVIAQRSASTNGAPENVTSLSISGTKYPAQKTVGVGMFPTTDTIQPVLPSWIYNDSLLPDLYKTILEATITTTGIDTTKLYPILMSSGLPRETLGHIWALANRTTPGKLTNEELYTVLAMIAVTQRGGPAVSTDILNQFASAPIPTLCGFPKSMPMAVNPLHLIPPGPSTSRPHNVNQHVFATNISTAPSGAALTQALHTVLMPTLSAQKAVKSEGDDFQDFQDVSKSGPIDDSFSDFQSDVSTKSTSTQMRNSVPALLLPLSCTAAPVSASIDKYAVFKGIDGDKSSEPTSTFAGDGFTDFKSSGADDGFTDFKTADSISPQDPLAKEPYFPTPFPTLPVQLKSSAQLKLSLTVADLDPFSSVNTTDCSYFPFATTFTSSKTTSLPAPPHFTFVQSPAVPTKNSTVPDDFGDFNLFGVSAKVISSSGQDDFADFMAFNSSTNSSELNINDKQRAIKQEQNATIPLLSTINVGQTTQTSSSASFNKYDIFKQLSLESSGLANGELKDAPPPVKNDNDFADFQADKYMIAESSSEKSFVDKIAAFKQAKEDAASVKSLDLPSIGGSSVGKEDSEDALSIQFDMKLADVGGDMKHVMSDSSLDLPTISGQHPPAADLDDFKDMNDTNGSVLSSSANLDWSEKDEISQNRKQSNLFLSSDCGLLSSTTVFQKKETSFGSSENITMTTISKVTTFSSDEYFQEANSQSVTNSKKLRSDLFGPGLEDILSSSLAPDVDGQEKSLKNIVIEGTNTDDFGDFQREKPKISKFDFLIATSQGKVKSSEEMIKSELATLDLCAQGSHKRSLSLGDKEISRSSPLPAAEQTFRDRSNTLSEKPVLPVIRDKYKDLTGEVEESERYAYEWQRCLESALQVIKKANDTLNGISSSSVCTEVIQSAQGMEYLLGVVEVYRVTKRVELGIKATAVCSEKLQLLLKEINKLWNNLIGFMSLAALTPHESLLDFSSCLLRPGIKNAHELACGVCLLNVDSRSKKEEKPAVEHPRKAFNSETDNFKLSYGGHQYHASCANFWINCVEPKPPGLFLPDLL